LLALEVAHKEQIVHRDIKPTNIMILPDGRAKVMDFGIAKIPSLHMTTTGTVLGTPYYMSPEQITGQQVDVQSDIFAVGAVFYQIITGVKPFEGETTVALAYKIVEVEPVPPRILKTNIPQAVENIIKKALAKNTGARYKTPKQMLEELRAYKERDIEQPQGDFESTVRVPPSAPSTPAPPQPRAAEAQVPVEAPREQQKPMDSKGGEAAPAPISPDIEIPKAPKKPDPILKTPPPVTPGGNSMKTLGIVLGLIVVIGGGVFGVMRYLKPSTTIVIEKKTTPPETKTETKKEVAPPPVVDKKPATDNDALIRQAKTEMQKNPDKALALLNQVLAQEPNNFEANYQMGRLLTFKKDYNKAIPYYNKSMELDNKVPEIPFNLGFIYMNQGRFDEAVKYYEICRGLSPSFQDEVLTNLGLCYYKSQNYPKAREVLREALKLNPGNVKAKAILKSIK